MKTLWQVGDSDDPFAAGFAQLQGDDAVHQLVVHDGAEGASFKLTTDQLLDLAYTIYEELG